MSDSKQLTRPDRPERILILGGGFGGVHVARELERLFGRGGAEITLVARDNFFLVTPLLFEACSGTLELRHCSVPIRAYLRRTKFVEGTVVQPIDLERRVVRAIGADGTECEIAYDTLVLALGAWTNQKLIAGSERAFTFKTLADAILLRNHVLERFEHADVASDPEVRRKLLTFAVVGGGLVGTELFGELTAFARAILRFYRNLRPSDLRFVLIERSDEIMPEIDGELVRYALRVLGRRPGVEIRTGTTVKAIERDALLLDNERIEAGTIVLAAGILPSPISAALPLEKSKHGHLVTDAAMRTGRKEVWALGDCAQIPGPNGKPYPYLAQHALREARLLARNIHAVALGRSPSPMVFETLGMMASFGQRQGVARILRLRLRGIVAWWLRRTYYLFQTPGLERKLRIVVDWTLALVLPPDVVKVDMRDERQLLSLGSAAGAEAVVRAAASDGQASAPVREVVREARP